MYKTVYQRGRIPQRTERVKRDKATNINHELACAASEENILSVNAIHNVKIPIDKVISCFVTSPAKSKDFFSLSSISESVFCY